MSGIVVSDAVSRRGASDLGMPSSASTAAKAVTVPCKGTKEFWGGFATGHELTKRSCGDLHMHRPAHN